MQMFPPASTAAGRPSLRRSAVALIVVALTLSAGLAAGAPVEAEPRLQDPGRDAKIGFEARVDGDDNDTAAENKVLRADLDLSRFEPGAALMSRVDVYFYRANGSQTDPRVTDTGTITEIRSAHAAASLESDGENGHDQSVCLATPSATTQRC